MRINFNTLLIDVRDNEPLFTDKVNKKTKEVEQIPLTLLNVSGEALCNIDPKENLSAEEKYQLTKLLDKVYTHKDDCEISIEELATIKARIAKFYSPLVLLAVDKILEK